MYVLNMITDNALVVKAFLLLHNYLHLFSSLLRGGESLEQVSWVLSETLKWSFKGI